jgi:hypothetical protein
MAQAQADREAVGIREGVEVKQQVGWTVRGVLCTAFVAIGVLFTSTATAATCPNEALRQQQGSTALPDCMALEMVSPARKFSQPAFLPSFSLDGERLLIKVEAGLGQTPGYQHFGGDAYVASRGSLGWETSATAPPFPTLVAGGARAGNPSIFTPALEAWAQFGATQEQAQVGVARLFGGGLDGSFESLSPLLVPIDNSGSNETQIAVAFLELDGSSTDLRTNVFRVQFPSTSYFPDDPRSGSPEPEAGKDRNSYVAFLDEGGEPALELLARDKDGAVYGGRCGAHLGGEGATFNQGAVSPDGDRIFFSTRPAQPWDPEEGEEPPCDTDHGLRILERVATPEGPAITEIAPGGGGPGAPGDDLFQGASVDGTRVYFTSPRKLTPSDVDASSEPCAAELGASKGCDLYLYDGTRPEGDRIVQVSAGEGPEPADVLSSIPAVSGDGSRAYFVAQGVLTSDANPEGATAILGQPNLYAYELEGNVNSFITTLVPGDQSAMWGSKGTYFNDASAVPRHGPEKDTGGDGHVFAFASKAPVTPQAEDGPELEKEDDNDEGLADVFRYDAIADTLELVSVPLEEGDSEPEEPPEHDVMVNPAVAEVVEYNFGEATRWVSEDGQIIAFATAERLVSADADAAVNPYVWSSGQLGRVPASITEPPAVSPVGGQIAFSTPATLLPRDIDTAQDVYVARPNGGFPEPAVPVPCKPLEEGSCQGPLPSAPPGVSSATTAPTTGNVKPAIKCKKGKVKRKGKCVKKPRKGKRAHHRRGGRR